MYKILSLGNSFSQDATAYLHQIADSAGIESKVLNLCIGGCSLERHAQNIADDAEAYSYMLNCDKELKKIKMSEALREEEWDFITIQQASHYSGLSDTYFPYAQIISDYAKLLAPSAALTVHQTWAYETTSTHPGFTSYESNQKIMYDRIVASYSALANKLGIGIIRCGELIQQLRDDQIFDIRNGGIAITRDGFHLNIPYGRYATALLWFKVLMGGDVYSVSFIPEGADTHIIDRIKQYVNEFNN